MDELVITRSFNMRLENREGEFSPHADSGCWLQRGEKILLSDCFGPEKNLHGN